MPAIIKLNRKNKPLWEFCWEDKYNGYVHITKKKGIYKLFFDNCVNPSEYGLEPDIWIGKLLSQNKEYFWVTCEREIKAESLILFRGKYTFDD